MNKVPKGFTCKCGKFHEFNVYVYAHMNVPLTFTCDVCRRNYTVLRGIAIFKRKIRKKIKM